MLAKRRETQTEREPPKIQAAEKEAKKNKKMMGNSGFGQMAILPGRGEEAGRKEVETSRSIPEKPRHATGFPDPGVT